MAVATSSHRHHFELKTSKHQDLFRLFRVVVTGDMVERGKPDPMIFVRVRTLLSLHLVTQKRHYTLIEKLFTVQMSHWYKMNH